ncbi:membrane protein of unknown function [Acetoanaerobium sticklandii]|uniref:Uncharacterized protein n=1 Tax=Acetoanaerobium sticklandii (strain ATCC 12662 / DSM 519 / JCM 1433 / CCUG 9281 / NCIMB 10654 / HF) TaxID=499177 RepID=E3PV89_ACESD|nr:hypothetical protein [Acetoanaerobium sticklandii]CBH22542.1 membrane protein of unknown function [Acetoanaerobium sticklandii]
MNKIVNHILSFLQLIILAIVFLVQYFSTRKMGMMRHVVYTNQKWEANYPIATNELGAIAVVAIIALIVGIKLFVKLKSENKDAIWMKIFALQMAVSIIYIGFSLIYSTEQIRSYYYINIGLLLTVFFQTMKSCIYLKTFKQL